MNHIIKNRSFLLALSGMLLLTTSCGSVHRFTRAKKVPREYSLNYCGEEIKAPKGDLNKELWIVFSDRENNQSFNNAGGKVKAKDVDYLEPFLVIGKKKKGEYLKLIKYSPDILKNGKLQYKQAEYYGWMHKSQLLLNRQAVTDISSGKKNKTLMVFADSMSINDPERYFSTDLIKSYKDLESKSQAGGVAPYSIVYQLKQSKDGTKTLLAKKPYVDPDEVSECILGWVDNSLIKDIGTGLHVKLQTIPKENQQFFINKRDEIVLTDDIAHESRMLSELYPTIRYNPVSSYSTNGSLVAFKTRMALPVFDYSNNYIFNVKGNPIAHKQFKTIAKNLKKINISFVFEGGEQTIRQFPQIVNSLQNLQPLFDVPDEDGYTYNFNCVMTFDDSGNLFSPVNMGFTSDYSQIINYLSDKTSRKDKLQLIKTPLNSWLALRVAVNSFKDHRDATNLIVLIGDKRTPESGVDADLLNQLSECNCRIIGFQIYAGEGDNYNNFVLDIEEMISFYADKQLERRHDVFVNPEQIKRSNSFVQAGEQKNGYRLDFPDNSVTQGALFFPQKSETLAMEILPNNIDTIIRNIKQDNNSIIRYMTKSFRTVGNNRTIFDSLFVRNYGIDTLRMPGKKLIASFENEIPGWYMPSKIVVLDDSENHTLDYYLMLSELEMKELKEFVAALSELEVDYIDTQREKKEQKRKPCDCHDDDLFLALERGEFVTDSGTSETIFLSDSISSGKYANTKKIRKHLKKKLLEPIKHDRLCKENRRIVQGVTLADAQYRITGCPTSNEMLNSIRVKLLKKKKIIRDEMLEELVGYYKTMKKELDKAEEFESNGEVYYWIDRELLP